MSMPSKENSDAISAIMNMLETGVDRELNNLSERAKYAAWLVALATAGVALILSEVRRIVETRHQSTRGMFIAVILCVAVIIANGFINRLVNRVARTKRNTASIIGVQVALLRTSDEAFRPTDTREYMTLPRKLLDGAFLSSEHAKNLVD